MDSSAPVTLEAHGVRLEPLAIEHRDELAAAAADGRLWELWYASVPAPHEMDGWITQALQGVAAGTTLAWAVRDLRRDALVGSTRFYEMAPAIGRVEIGYTWYARSAQRSLVNAACKLLLLGHAFDTLGCAAVGLRTDRFNFASQRAIEALGAQREGVLRHHMARRDGSVRDTVMYSILAAEWADVRRHLRARLALPARSS